MSDNNSSGAQQPGSTDRYLITVTNMDAIGPTLGAEPVVSTIIIEASSRDEAEAFSRQFALDCAEERSAWIEEAEGLPLEEAQQVLAGNGLYVADPVVELLSDVQVSTTARGVLP